MKKIDKVLTWILLITMSLLFLLGYVTMTEYLLFLILSKLNY